MTDYTKMSGAEVLAAMGDDARKWAASFMQHLAASPTKEVNEDLMQSWFANAIVRGQDELRWRQERHAADTAQKRREIVFQALGEASMCWDQADKAGTFESTRAEDVGNRLLADLDALKP